MEQNRLDPLIQATSFEIKDDGAVDIKMQFMLQTDNFIHNVEPSYRMDSILRVKNCLYARYIGPEDKLKFAYDKLGVYAFENDIELEGCNYTIYVDRNEKEVHIYGYVLQWSTGASKQLCCNG